MEPARRETDTAGMSPALVFASDFNMSSGGFTTDSRPAQGVVANNVGDWDRDGDRDTNGVDVMMEQ